MAEFTKISDEELDKLIKEEQGNAEQQEIQGLGDEELDRLISEEQGIQTQQQEGLDTFTKKILPTFLTGATPERGERTLLGNIFERPGAAVRGAIQAKPGERLAGFRQGALFPEETPTFTELSQRTLPGESIPRTGNRRIDEAVIASRGLAGFGRDVAATAADIATNPADVLGFVLGTKVAQGLFKPVVEVAKRGQAAKNIAKAINKPLAKAIKPSTIGKKTFKQLKTSKQKAATAVETIVDNKQNLKLIDENGQVLAKLPESLDEFSQAIAQTKSQIFKQWEAATAQAGKTGTKVNLRPIAKQLDAVIKSKPLKLSNPTTVEYAKALKARLLKKKTLTPTESDELIRIYNNSLEAFYRNPTFDTASRATVDSGIANNLRKALDEVVEKATDIRIQPLKTKYGALKSIEADVAKRTLADARKSGAGIVDLTNLFSGSRIVEGLVNLNPGRIASGATQTGLGALVKRLNNPNRIIKSMFINVDKLKQVKPPAIRNLTKFQALRQREEEQQRKLGQR